MKRRTAAPGAALGLVDAGPLLAAPGGVAVVNGNAVAPPELARNAPIADVVHPIEVDPREVVGNDPDPTVADDLHGWVGQRLDLQIPLVEEQRLEYRAGARAMAHRVNIGLLLDQLTVLLQLGHQARASFLGSKPGISARLGVHRAVQVHDVDRWQPMALGDLEVGRIMGRGYFDRTGAELGIDRFVGDDQPDPIHVWNAHMPANQMLVARIARMYRHTNVAQDGLRPGRRDGDRFAVQLHDGVADIGQLALGLFEFNLEV